MPSVIDRTEQIVSLTDMARNGTVVIDQLKDQRKFLIMQRSTPCAVLLSISEYENTLNQIERLEKEVRILRDSEKKKAAQQSLFPKA